MLEKYPDLSYELHVEDKDHILSTSFVKKGETVVRTIINEPYGKGDLIEYSNGVKILRLLGVKEGMLSYYTNYPLKEVAQDVYEFEFS